MSRLKTTRRLFRNRPAPEVISFERRGNVMTTGRPFLPSVAAWVEANRSRFKAGTVETVIVSHDSQCRYPAGGSCTCIVGPEIGVEGINPRDN